jgi:hypothetical protein
LTLDLDAKTDRELLLLTVQQMGHLETHMKSMDVKLGVQNGRLSALEKWRWWVVGAGAVVVPLLLLLIYEVRMAVFGGFGS